MLQGQQKPVECQPPLSAGGTRSVTTDLPEYLVTRLPGLPGLPILLSPLSRPNLPNLPNFPGLPGLPGLPSLPSLPSLPREMMHRPTGCLLHAVAGRTDILRTWIQGAIDGTTARRRGMGPTEPRRPSQDTRCRPGDPLRFHRGTRPPYGPSQWGPAIRALITGAGGSHGLVPRAGLGGWLGSGVGAPRPHSVPILTSRGLPLRSGGKHLGCESSDAAAGHERARTVRGQCGLLE